jgi:hypothetical protein
LPPPSSQPSSLPTLTVRLVSGCLTRMIKRVAGRKVASAASRWSSAHVLKRSCLWPGGWTVLRSCEPSCYRIIPG